MRRTGDVADYEPRITERPSRFRLVQRFVIRDCLLMAATGFHSKSILSASTNNFDLGSWKGERRKERRKRKIVDRVFVRPTIFFPFYYGTREIARKDSLGSRFWFLDRRRAIYGGEMKESGESLDLEQRSGETLADARHGSR